MIDIVKYIKINDKEFPVAFTYNVMEVFQTKYGSLEKWGNALQPVKKKINLATGIVEKDEKGNELYIALEPNFKDVIFTFKEMINEGIDIENEEWIPGVKGEQKPFITHKQAGRFISYLGTEEVIDIILSLTVESSGAGNDEKNSMTTQTQTD